MSEENEQQYKLDGSFGAGINSELTIYTKAEDGRTKEETFVMPYLLINWGVLVAIDKCHLILGYKVMKQERPDQLKDLNLGV